MIKNKHLQISDGTRLKIENALKNRLSYIYPTLFKLIKQVIHCHIEKNRDVNVSSIMSIPDELYNSSEYNFGQIYRCKVLFKNRLLYTGEAFLVCLSESKKITVLLKDEGDEQYFSWEKENG